MSAELQSPCEPISHEPEHYFECAAPPHVNIEVPALHKDTFPNVEEKNSFPELCETSTVRDNGAHLTTNVETCMKPAAKFEVDEEPMFITPVLGAGVVAPIRLADVPNERDTHTAPLNMYHITPEPPLPPITAMKARPTTSGNDPRHMSNIESTTAGKERPSLIEIRRGNHHLRKPNLPTRSLLTSKKDWPIMDESPSIEYGQLYSQMDTPKIESGAVPSPPLTLPPATHTLTDLGIASPSMPSATSTDDVAAAKARLKVAEELLGRMVGAYTTQTTSVHEIKRKNSAQRLQLREATKRSQKLEFQLKILTQQLNHQESALLDVARELSREKRLRQETTEKYQSHQAYEKVLRKTAVYTRAGHSDLPISDGTSSHNSTTSSSPSTLGDSDCISPKTQSPMTSTSTSPGSNGGVASPKGHFYRKTLPQRPQLGDARNSSFLARFWGRVSFSGSPEASGTAAAALAASAKADVAPRRTSLAYMVPYSPPVHEAENDMLEDQVWSTSMTASSSPDTMDGTVVGSTIVSEPAESSNTRDSDMQKERFTID